MADSDSDLETDSFQSALDALSVRHCSDESSPKSREYCTEFCALVEEHTGRWQVPLPQLRLLRTALCSFTQATASFPDACQHMRYALSSLALSYFELMLFFSKEEFVEAPMKEILDSFQECHLRLLRHRNVYLVQVRQTIKAGGPWESPVLQGIMRDTSSLTQTQVDEYLSSEVPVFLELRVRYLQACERVQEAMALTKTCLEHSKAGKHHYFHQAYLICLYKASLHEHLHKEYHAYLNAHMAELDGRDAVEIICNTESVEKGDVLLSMSRAFLSQQLHNGDMYYIWDLVFIWSRLHLRAHPSRQGFLADCRQMASSASNVRAIFPFIKVVTAELGTDGVQCCVELCAAALRQCVGGGLRADPVAYSLVCKAVAFLLPGDLEVCRAAALLVFCQERSLEAYRTVCLLYTHPDEELLHPYVSPIPTNVRFHMLQILKEGLCFDPEFWNLLTLRTHCLELFSDKALKAAVLSEMEAEREEKEHEEEMPFLAEQRPSEPCPLHATHAPQKTVPLHSHAASVRATKPAEAHRTTGSVVSDSGAPRVKRSYKKRREPKRTPPPPSDDEADVSDDPEIKFYGAQFKPSPLANNSQYSLRRKYTRIVESSAAAAPAPVKCPPNRQREYLSRCVKNNILKRKGRKKRWLQGVPVSEPAPQGLIETTVTVKVKGKRGRKRKIFLQRFELSYPENEVPLEEEDYGIMDEMDTDGGGQEESRKENEHEINNALGDITRERIKELVEERLGGDVDHVNDESTLGERVNRPVSHAVAEVNSASSREDRPPGEPPELPPDHTADESGELAFELLGCPIELFHNYALNSKKPDAAETLQQQPPQSTEEEEAHAQNGDALELEEKVETIKGLHPQVKVKKSWKEKMLQSQRYCHVTHHCIVCQKDFKGLNVLRHALAHLKKNKLRCILCGKWFRQLPFAKNHIMDHIDTMCKDNDNPGEKDSKDKTGKKDVEKLDDDGKPSKKDKPSGEDGPSGNEPDTEVTPVNGTEVDSENANQDGDEDHQRPSSPSQQQQPPKSKKNNLKARQGVELSRESRIIRNLRANVRKLHRNGNNADFTDEQVVFSEDLVMVTVRDHGASVATEQAGAEEKVVEEEEEEVKEKRAGENGYGGFSVKYNLCPSERCDKVFAKLGPTMRHALKFHGNEDRVLEKTFVWSNRKCLTCQRKMQFLQQYKDHMALHDAAPPPLRHFCVHTACDARFPTTQELKDHVATTHDPFRPTCCYAGCRQQFPLLQGLYDHEWRHYTPAPQQKEEMTIGAPDRRAKTQSAEAPWKQRVKIEEIWMQQQQNKGHRQEISKSVGTLLLLPETAESCEQTTATAAVVSDPGAPGDQSVHVEDVATPLPEGGVDVSQSVAVETTALFNGHVVEREGDRTSEGEAVTASSFSDVLVVVKATPEQKTTTTTTEPGLDIKEPGETVTVKADCLEELRNAKLANFKAEDPANTYFVKAPMIRPPPSAYMNEKELSMRKRRHVEENAPRSHAQAYKKNWNSKKTSQGGGGGGKKVEAVPEVVPTRSRCNKCLAIFASVEEMKKHEALNTCSALFGFDSDDES